MASNNPLNIRPVSGGWKGQTATDARGLCDFETKALGFRAAIVNLASTWRKRPLSKRTVAGIIERWAPAVGDFGDNNDPRHYAATVAGWMRWDPDAALPIFQSDGKSIGSLDLLFAMVRGMTKFERGHKYKFRDSEIIDGIGHYMRDRMEGQG